ncbi:MAG: hypothetical protein CM15mP23_04830 [Cryomorphaceae bacterium]|nr:MAG: hypothetical protein CM15mP23_04830 [Cryomorphaceae bacterium]
MFDSYGDGWNGASAVLTSNGEVILDATIDSGSEAIADFNLNSECEFAVFGCTDPGADNYDPNAKPMMMVAALQLFMVVLILVQIT